MSFKIEKIFFSLESDLYDQLRDKFKKQCLLTPLFCQISGKQLELPVRNTECKSEYCIFSFDSIQDEINNGKKQIQCPQCKTNININNFKYDQEMDGYLTEIYSKYPEALEKYYSIKIYKDGKYEFDLIESNKINNNKLRQLLQGPIESINQVSQYITNEITKIRDEKFALLNNNQSNKIYQLQVNQIDLYEQLHEGFQQNIIFKKTIQDIRFAWSRIQNERNRPAKIHFFFPNFPTGHELVTVNIMLQTDAQTQVVIDYLNLFQMYSSACFDSSLNLWLTGGQQIQDSKTSNQCYVVDCRDIYLNQVVAIQNKGLIQERGCHSSIYVKPYVYIMSGAKNDGQKDQTLTSCERYDTNNPQKGSENIANCPVGVTNANILNYKNQFIYLFGGQFKKQSVNFTPYEKYYDIQKYNIKSNSWQVITIAQNEQIYNPLKNCCIFYSQQQDQIILLGGEDIKLNQREGRTKQLFIYNPNNDSFIKKIEEPVRECDSFWDTQYGQYNNKIYFINYYFKQNLRVFEADLNDISKIKIIKEIRIM